MTKSVLNYFFIFYILIGCLKHQLTIAAAPYRQSNSIYYEPKCIDKETGREFFVGEAENRHGKCARAQCLGDLQIAEYNCKVPHLEGNCSTIASPYPNANYPDCCPLYECQINRNDDKSTVEIQIYNHHGSLQRTQIRQVFVLEIHPSDESTGQIGYTKFHVPYNANRN